MDETRITLKYLTLKKDREELKDEAISFFYRFFQLIKNAHFHKINNQALLTPINNFLDCLNELLLKENNINLEYKDNTLFYNKNRIRFNSEEFEYAKDIFKFFEERQIGGIAFKGNLKKEEIFKFLSIFVYSNIKEFEKIKLEIERENLPISIEKLKRESSSYKKANLDKRLYTFINYSKAIVLCEKIKEEQKSSFKREFYISKLYRIIQNFIDICKEDDHTFLALAQVKNPKKKESTHNVNTSILSIALGQKLGLTKDKLLILGITSVFYIEDEISSIKNILNLNSLSPSVIYRTIVTFENSNLICNKRWEEKHLFSKIIKICSDYDKLTTFDFQDGCLLPDEALKFLKDNREKYDEALLKVFINMMGIYPSGTFVLLSSGEKGLVLLGGGDVKRSKSPIVEIIETGEVVDLSKEGEKRYILSTISPYEVGKSFFSIFLGEQNGWEI